MKTMYNFIYCDSVLTTRTVFYHVRCGTSRRDLLAKQFLNHLARSPDYYFVRHSLQSMQFIEQCAVSIYKGIDVLKALKLIRRVVIDVQQLVALVKNNPHSLLNGLKINAIENKMQVLPQPVHVKNLSKQCKQQTAKKNSRMQ